MTKRKHTLAVSVLHMLVAADWAERPATISRSAHTHPLQPYQSVHLCS